MSNLVAIRNFNESDKAFVYSTFLKGVLHGCPGYEGCLKDAFFAVYPQVLDGLLANASVNVLIACLSDEPDVVLGYAIVGPKTLHWAYTKASWRGQGIANMLLAGSEISFFSHTTKPGRAIATKKGWTYNPFLATI